MKIPAIVIGYGVFIVAALYAITVAHRWFPRAPNLPQSPSEAEDMDSDQDDEDEQ